MRAKVEQAQVGPELDDGSLASRTFIKQCDLIVVVGGGLDDVSMEPAIAPAPGIAVCRRTIHRDVIWNFWSVQRVIIGCAVVPIAVKRCGAAFGIGLWGDEICYRNQPDTVASGGIEHTLGGQRCACRAASTGVDKAFCDGIIDELMEHTRSVRSAGHLLTVMHMECAEVGFSIYESHPGIDTGTGAYAFHIVFEILELCGFCETAELYLETIGEGHAIGAGVILRSDDVIDVDRIVFALIYQLYATKYGRISAVLIVQRVQHRGEQRYLLKISRSVLEPLCAGIFRAKADAELGEIGHAADAGEPDVEITIVVGDVVDLPYRVSLRLCGYVRGLVKQGSIETAHQAIGDDSRWSFSLQRIKL